MKSTLSLLAVLTGAALAAPPMTDRISPEQMAQRQSSNNAFAELQKQAQAAEKEATVVRPGEQSIINQSEILHDGQHWTLVPRGAVLNVPAQMKPRVGTKPLGTLLSWTDFLTANRAWISTEEVSYDQACGKKPLPEARVEYWKNQTSVIVAVYQGGPISVKQVEPAPATTPAVTAK
ncbi:hypothetical protein [Haloferula sp. BvORR071]|uniref:hypothetical protein n=1 Tax=Haloferula sp. BvORR071 TaxID=1396141 RepID=UPI0005561D84|nr:hypothetical protein [Haloferula sp. BvORR071]